MKSQIDMAWGDPVVIRQALVETLGISFPFQSRSIEGLSYPPRLCTEKLIGQLKSITFIQTGISPKHVTLTCGATGAIHAALYALRDRWEEYVVVGKRYFPFYPNIIGMSGMAVR